MQPKASIETITPALAEKWLETMVPNRKISESLLLDYAIAMEGNKWSLNGETVKFDSDGRLFDGQHRLRACVLARKQFESWVVRGVQDEQAFATVDTGKFRTAQDVFSIDGWANHNCVAAGAKLAMLYQQQRIGWNGITGYFIGRKNGGVAQRLVTSEGRNLRARMAVPKEDQLKFAHANREALTAAAKAANCHKARRYLTPAVFTASHFLFAEKSRLQAEHFYDDLAEGVGLDANDPVWVLRERLTQLARAKTRTYSYVSFGLTIKAWNKRRHGEKVKTLHASDAEEFPKVA